MAWMDENLLQDVVAAALKAGADAAEAVFAERQALSVEVRAGVVEELEREESRDLGLRVFVGQRQAVVSGSDISAEARAKLIERVVAMARLAPEDPYAGLAPADRLAKGPGPDLDLFDPEDPAPDALEAEARAAAEAAGAPEGIAVPQGGASWTKGSWRLITSGGFSGLHRATNFGRWGVAIAQDEHGMETAYDSRSARWRADLPSPEALGAEAARRALAQLGARKIDSVTAPVIFENRLAASLVGPLLGAISGPSVARGVSFLKDKLGQPLFAKGVNILDQPHRPRGLGSTPYDDEGVVNGDLAVIEDGVLTTWLLNTAAARQLGLRSNGRASRGLAGPPGVGPTNLTVQPGEHDLAALMKDAGSGLLVTSMFGPSLNANTGDWSIGVSGFWFEGGERAYPVNEITVAGNLIDVYGRLVPGADLEYRGAVNSPSILVPDLAIAGK